MRVLLVSANREHLPNPIFTLCLGYIAAATQQAGHEVAVADPCFGKHPLRDLRRQIVASRPDGDDLSIPNVDNAATRSPSITSTATAKWLPPSGAATRHWWCWAAPAFPSFPKSLHGSAARRLGHPGRGEQTIVAPLDALDNARDAVGITGLPPRRQDSGNGVSIPMPQEPEARPSRHLFDYSRYLRRGGTGNIPTKRVCVFKCNYCTYPLLEGKRFRARAADDVVDEIEALRRGLELRWSCYATPVKLDRNQGRLMARAG